MNVLLIRPPYVLPYTSVYGNQGVPSLGLAYLAGALREQRHRVSCLDAFAESMDQFRPIEGTELLVNGLTADEIVERISPEVEVIGISCMFSNEWINTKEIIVKCKQRFPNAFLVLGGEHVTADAPHILRNFPEVDCCVLGEGEDKLKSLINGLEAKRALKEIGGITFLDREKDEIVSPSFEYRKKEIDQIARPAWDLLPLEKFLERGMGMSCKGMRNIPMLLSRGCPYRCTFCSNEQMWTTRWVSRSIDEVIDEIKFYKRRYEIDHVDFYDLTAVVNKKWTIEFCERLISENLGVTWSLPSGTRSEALDLEVLSLLKRSGCLKITYAPESGSEKMLELIKKKVKLKNMLASMRNAVKLGLVVKSNIIFGFPDETLKDVFWNFVLITKMAVVGVHDVPCFGFTPYPGSVLFDRLLKEGKIVRDANYDLYLANLVYTSALDRKSWSDHLPSFLPPLLSLGGMAYFYSLQYLIRPWRFFKMVTVVLKNKPQTMLENAFCHMIDDFVKGRRKASTRP